MKSMFLLLLAGEQTLLALFLGTLFTNGQTKQRLVQLIFTFLALFLV